jgi:DDE superfamily endonuclease
MPSVSISIFEIVLAQLARDLALGSAKQIVLVLDGAGWHNSSQLKIPYGIHLVFLPPYSPELQPAERLWPYNAKSPGVAGLFLSRNIKFQHHQGFIIRLHFGVV